VDTRLLAERVELSLLARKTGGRTTHDIAQTVLGGTEPKHVARIEDTRQVMADRRAVLGSFYPLGKGDELLTPNNSGLTWYSLLMLCAQNVKQNLEMRNQLLDAICAKALPALLGPGTEVVNFAWPVRSPSEPRPEMFPEAVVWLGQRLGLSVGHGYRPPERKDGGVDLVAFRKLSGSCQAAPMALVQTTVSSDLRAKGRDINVDTWRTWIDLSPSTLVVLAVPHVAAPGELAEAHTSGVILLDRLRLVQLLADSPMELPADLKVWAEQKWSQYKNSTPSPVSSK
jgi:hypothetical protein